MDDFEDYDKYADVFLLNNRAFFKQKNMTRKVISMAYKKNGIYWVILNTKYTYCREVMIDVTMYLIALRFYEVNKLEEQTEVM